MKILINLFLLMLVVFLLPQMLAFIYYRPVSELIPYRKAVILLIALIISSWLIVKWYRWILINWTLERYWELVVLFAAGAICWMISSLWSSNSTLDIHIHDTYYVIGRAQIDRICFFLLSLFSFVYYIIQVILKRKLNRGVARIHFWVSFIGLNFLFGVVYVNQFVTLPRRYIEYRTWPPFMYEQYIARFMFSIAVAVLIAQIIFLVNVVYSLFRKNERPVRN